MFSILMTSLREVCLRSLLGLKGLTDCYFILFNSADSFSDSLSVIVSRESHSELLVCLYCSLCYSQDDFVHMSLSTWVRIVEGKVVALDR